jgi:hypothetical protein
VTVSTAAADSVDAGEAVGIAPTAGLDARVNQALLERLRAFGLCARAEIAADGAAAPLVAEWARADVRFVASAPQMEAQYDRAVRELFSCIRPAAGGEAILHEGGVYLGCWLESTGTISAELLSRFLPAVAGRTFAGFARHQREDGLFPYKLTADAAAFSQIQLVSPLARSVWTHARLNGADEGYLRTLYQAMARYDAWLARWRDTRGTGGVEAFCTYDTGHDLSARFWHVPDSPLGNDPARYNPGHPTLPFVAPDLTANVACQRLYLARIAEALGEDGDIWRDKAEQSRAALFGSCYDEVDGFFYDLDRHERHVKVQSDVLLRVLACEIGDDALFAAALERYLLNTRKFFAKFPFTSLALDDPRFDPAADHNTWCGPTNLLSLIRAPHAFEAHGRHIELSWVLYPTLMALFEAPEFAQTLSPFTGRAGYTRAYSPAILCLIDFVERLCGIMPRPDDTLWFTGLVPYQIERRDVAHETGYARSVDGHRFALLNSGAESVAYRDGEPLFACPKGVRVVTDRSGVVRGLIGMSVNEIAGAIRMRDGALPFRIGPNEYLERRGGALVRTRAPGYVPPST